MMNVWGRFPVYGWSHTTQLCSGLLESLRSSFHLSMLFSLPLHWENLAPNVTSWRASCDCPGVEQLHTACVLCAWGRKQLLSFQRLYSSAPEVTFRWTKITFAVFSSFYFFVSIKFEFISICQFNWCHLILLWIYSLGQWLSVLPLQSPLFTVQFSWTPTRRKIYS